MSAPWLPDCRWRLAQVPRMGDKQRFLRHREPELSGRSELHDTVVQLVVQHDSDRPGRPRDSSARLRTRREACSN